MHRSIRARALAIALCFALVAPSALAGQPEATRGTHEVHWFVKDSRWLRLELSTFYSDAGMEAVAGVVYGAPAPRAHDAPGAARTSRGEVEDPSFEAAPLRGVGEPPVTEEAWDKELEWRVDFDGNEIVTEYRIGMDRVALGFEREWIESGGPEDASGRPTVVRLEVNGRSTLVKWPVESDGGDARKGVRLAEWPAPLYDPDGFVAAWSNFRRMLDKVQLSGLAEAGGHEKAGCAGRCLACAGNLLGTLGTSIALVAACGGALVTGGSTAVACVVAFIAHEAAALATFASCGLCHDCVVSTRKRRHRERCCPCLGEAPCECPSTCNPVGS